MSEILKVAGIYSKEILERSSEEGLSHFSFDFRPRSPNFLQEYAFKDLIENHFHHQHKYYLHYQDEKKFMVDRMLDEIKGSLLKIGRTPDFMKSFILQFSDVREISYYESFPLKFIWEYHPLGDIEKIVQCSNNTGILIPYNYIRDAAQDGSLQEMTIKILRARQLKSSSQPNDETFQLTLQLDWNTDILPSLSEFLSFDIIELPINSEIELSYRNIDFTKMSNSLTDIKKIAFQST
jgi:hypothetical protein